MDTLTPMEFPTTPYFFDLNYGVLEIPTHETDYLIEGFFMDANGDLLYSNRHTEDDFAFDTYNVRFSDMCNAKLDK